MNFAVLRRRTDLARCAFAAAFVVVVPASVFQPSAHASVPLAALRAAAAAQAETASAPVAASSTSGAVRSAPTPDVRPAPRVEIAAEPAPTRSLVSSGPERSPPVMPEADENAPLQFIVKFEEAEGAQWRDRYVADPQAAREAFAALGRRSSAFAGLRLLRMNNSGEATLEFEGPAPPIPAVRRELANDIVRRLSAADGVAYAETNLVGLRESQE